jgi:hypothetical protein
MVESGSNNTKHMTEIDNLVNNHERQSRGGDLASLER